jgi:hypothetical protein
LYDLGLGALGVGTNGQGTAQAAGAHPPDALARAHAALLKQTDLQFGFRQVVPPKPPAWLEALLRWLGHVFHFIAPATKYLFWGGVIIGVGAILYFLFWEVAALRLGWRKPAKVRAVALQQEWTPAKARAHTLLEDADRLAAQGRFAEAVHLLLFRSIEDIDARWPNTVRPALTSRDIASHPRLSDAGRGAFSGIAQVVERSFFGGADVGSGDFQTCRDAYAAFALPGFA